MVEGEIFMGYKFLLADETKLDEIVDLIIERIKWMDRVGIKQWNVTNYMEAYPKQYYQRQINERRLYVIVEDSKVIAAVVLLEEDDRWDDNISAYYLHNFVTDTNVKGVGKKMLEFVENLARENGKSKLRLDCAEDNEFLNNYYENQGYHLVGKCEEGLYKGNKREKNLAIG